MRGRESLATIARFLNNKSECVVADWGLAAQNRSLDRSGLRNGCHARDSSSVERNRLVASATVASDVYSLGASAYWMPVGATWPKVLRGVIAAVS